jgi:soluble lytic murein transglycosylase-like protein
VTAVNPAPMTSVVRPDPRTGKLVRSVVVTRKPVAQHKAQAPLPAATIFQAKTSAETWRSSAASANLEEAVDLVARRHGLSPELLDSVIQVESNYNANAVSPKGAFGIMQLIPATARRFGVWNVFDPLENLEGGARYLRYLLDLYGGEPSLALAAYNAGEGAVKKYGTIPPYKETQEYVNRVAKRLHGKTPAANLKQQSAVKPAGSAEPTTEGNHVVEVVGDDGTVRYVSR